MKHRYSFPLLRGLFPSLIVRLIHWPTILPVILACMYLLIYCYTHDAVNWIVKLFKIATWPFFIMLAYKIISGLKKYRLRYIHLLKDKHNTLILTFLLCSVSIDILSGVMTKGILFPSFLPTSFEFPYIEAVALAITASSIVLGFTIQRISIVENILGNSSVSYVSQHTSLKLVVTLLFLQIIIFSFGYLFNTLFPCDITGISRMFAHVSFVSLIFCSLLSIPIFLAGLSNLLSFHPLSSILSKLTDYDITDLSNDHDVLHENNNIIWALKLIAYQFETGNMLIGKEMHTALSDKIFNSPGVDWSYRANFLIKSYEIYSASISPQKRALAYSSLYASFKEWAIGASKDNSVFIYFDELHEVQKSVFSELIQSGQTDLPAFFLRDYLKGFLEPELSADTVLHYQKSANEIIHHTFSTLKPILSIEILESIKVHCGIVLSDCLKVEIPKDSHEIDRGICYYLLFHYQEIFKSFLENDTVEDIMIPTPFYHIFYAAHNDQKSYNLLYSFIFYFQSFALLTTKKGRLLIPDFSSSIILRNAFKSPDSPHSFDVIRQLVCFYIQLTDTVLNRVAVDDSVQPYYDFFEINNLCQESISNTIFDNDIKKMVHHLNNNMALIERKREEHFKTYTKTQMYSPEYFRDR